MTDQCKARVLKRDTYRVARGKGFRMHYNEERCSRKAIKDGLCKQHGKPGTYVVLYRHLDNA